MGEFRNIVRPGNWAAAQPNEGCEWPLRQPSEPAIRDQDSPWRICLQSGSYAFEVRGHPFILLNFLIQVYTAWSR